jgi:hypothetical protein
MDWLQTASLGHTSIHLKGFKEFMSASTTKSTQGNDNLFTNAFSWPPEQSRLRSSIPAVSQTRTL